MKEELCCYTKKRSNKAANLSGVSIGKTRPAIESSAIDRFRMSSQSQKSFIIRRADSNDGEAILACLAAAFARYRNSYTPAGFADTVLDRESVQRRLREMCVLVALSQGKVVGTLACAVKGDEGHLRGMAVLPDWQGSGVASALLQAAEAEVRSQHCTRVTLDTTDPLARAMRFYARHGFTRSGRVSDFFGMPQHEWVKFL
jgi:N-acetylglutamate synthase-like GNAT family acetyltransferase